MSVQYNEFLNCARRFVQGQSPAEINLRNSASRAYYYLFHKIRETFRRHIHARFKDGKSDHREACNFLRRINQSVLADRLHQCWERRLSADYDINKLFPEIEADEQLKEVQSIASRIDSLAIGRP